VARPDVALRNSGPRLPNGTFAVTDDYSDPANGERVPRCMTCGLPARTGNSLLDFELYLHGRRAGRYRLCERDFNRVNPPPISDPLDVSESA
jgi:hypothetical protein